MKYQSVDRQHSKGYTDRQISLLTKGFINSFMGVFIIKVNCFAFILNVNLVNTPIQKKILCVNQSIQKNFLLNSWRLFSFAKNMP